MDQVFQTALGAIVARSAAPDEGRTFDWFTMGWSFPVVRQVANGFQVTLNDLRYGANLDPGESFFSIGARFDAAYFSQCPSAAVESAST